MSQVLIIQIDGQMTALETGTHAGQVIANFVERVADHAHEDVEWALVEATPLDDWGPGDIAEIQHGAEEVPSASFQTQHPDS